MISIEESIDNICKKIGIPKEELRSSVEDWGVAMMTRGVIVDLKLKRWRAKASLDETDLGIHESNKPSENIEEWNYFINNYMNFGTKTLLPRRVIKKLNSIESKARKNLESYSFSTVWGKFVPCTVFEDWKTRDNDIKKEYFDEAKNFYNQYDMLIAETLEEYKILAKKAYKESCEISYKDFENLYIENISRRIIPDHLFLKSFEYDSLYYYIPIPSEVNYEIKVATDFANEADQIRHEMKMRQQIREETVKMKSKYIEDFMKETAGKIREIILNSIEDVKKGLIINNKSLKSASNKNKMLSMIDKIRSLDFYDDERVRNALDKLQIDLDKDPKFRSEDDIMSSLEELEDAAKSNVFDLVVGRHKMLEL